MSVTHTESTVERASRWVASRLSRRSFVGRAAQLAVVVAGGPTLVGLMARQAEARVCGQSGVSPKCPTFDCVGPGRVWGWCWYASPGCCSGPGIKKICDCCTYQYPNVHGYCPSGYNVECIVESCWADPRVMTVPVSRIAENDPPRVAAAVSRLRWPAGRGGGVVIGDAQHRAMGSLAATVAGSRGRPFLLTARDGLSPATADEINRLNAETAIVVGPSISSQVDAQLIARGLTVERVGSGSTLGTFSLSVARWMQARRRGRRLFVLGTAGASWDVAPLVAAAAGTSGWAIVFGPTAARRFMDDPDGPDLAYMVGAGASEWAGSVPGANPLRSTTAASLAREVATVMVSVENIRGVPLALAPNGAAKVSLGLAGLGGYVLFHDHGVLDGANASWIRLCQPFFTRGIAAGTSGSLGTQGIYDLQSSLNHFDTYRLIGVSGQGLPVISQPQSEREIGRARVAGAPPEEENGGYWTSRANPG